MKRRIGEIALGKFGGLTPERIRVGQLLEDVLEDYALHERRSIVQLKPRLKHLTSLASIRAAELSTQDVKRYISRRQRDEASNATINRDLQVLKRALALGLQCDPPKVVRAPYIHLLPEDNVWTGFLDDKQYLSLRDQS